MSKQKLQAFQDLPLSPEFCGSPSVGFDLWLVALFIYSLRALALQLSLTIPMNVRCGKKVEIWFLFFLGFFNAYLAVLTLLDRNIKCCEISAL